MRRIIRPAMAKKCARFCHSHTVDINQPQVRLVDEGRRLKRVSDMLAPHLPLRQTLQFLVHEGCQPIQRVLVSLPPGDQELGDGRRRRWDSSAHGFRWTVEDSKAGPSAIPLCGIRLRLSGRGRDAKNGTGLCAGPGRRVDWDTDNNLRAIRGPSSENRTTK